MREIFDAYQFVGCHSKFFDRMMTRADLPARLLLKFFWGLDEQAYQKFLTQAFAGIPENFSGRLLEVPVGTGVLSLPVCKNLDGAEIFCVDCSDKMLDAAKLRAEQMNLRGVKFILGDVGNLPFADNFFDLVLSINGFHVFGDKIAAWSETRRVLKRGGIFCGCMYIKGENCRTDFFVKNFCEPNGFFSPPYETFASLKEFLSNRYSRAEVSHVESFAGFICVK
ncbi:MAG: class I SAM-dependent methyltransferase [Selenomonadaceae bacterium]|nr:class I SAM-dependent methyltransferase [Selenomonadaceae bacterium]